MTVARTKRPEIRGSALAAAILLAGCSALATACGPPAPPDVPDTPDKPNTPDPADTGGDPAPPGPAPTGDSPTPAPAPTAKGGPEIPMVPIGTSKLAVKVGKLGIDLKKAPKLAKIPLGKKKKLMPLFQKALGMKACTGCHVDGDFKAETRNLKIARGMWDNYVADLRTNDGGGLFCDSCHDGNSDTIPRHDGDAVQKMMTEEYEGKLTRADGEEHSCSTCHTDVFEKNIFEDVWKVGK
jgi:hypothetical protein